MGRGFGSGVVASQAASPAASPAAAGSLFGFLSPMDLVSYGSLVGLHFLDKAIAGKEPIYYEHRRTNLQINPQWPSRRLFGRVEVSGNLLWAGRRLYPWSGEQSSTNPVWSPIEELQSNIPSFFNQRIVLLDRAIWLGEGTAEQIDYVRINGELVKLDRVVLNGVPYYTPVRERFRYHSSVSSNIISPYYRKFYIREHFGVDRTDAELLARYSKQPDLDPDADLVQVEFDASGNQKVGYWHEEKKDADQSWIAMTLIDDDSEFWDGRNLSEMSFVMRGQRVTDMQNPSGGLVWTDNASAVQHWIETHLVAGQDASSVSLRHFQEAYNWCAIQKHNDFEKYFELPDGSRREASQGEQAAFYRDMPAYSKNGTFNGIIEEGDDVDAVRDQFDEIRQGFRYPYAGRLCITVGKNLNFEHAVVIDNEDIVSIRPEPQPRQSESPNTLQARMASSQAHGYEGVDLEISDDHAVARDGRPIIRSMGTLYGQTDYMEVARRMTSMVYRQRFNQRFRVTLVPQEKYFFIRPDDPVYLNSQMARKERYRCRVMAMEIADNGQITLMLRYAPPNEYIDQPVLPPIEQISEGIPVPLAVTDVTVHGSPGTKSNTASVVLEWPSPDYYRQTNIRWREQNGEWTAGVVSANHRGSMQRQALEYNFKIGTTYEFELVNQNRNGDLSAPYTETWVAQSDTEAPPPVSGLELTGVAGGLAGSRTPIDLESVPDYDRSEVRYRWTPTGETEQTRTEVVYGSAWVHADLVPIGVVQAFHVSVVDIDRAGNESVPATATASSIKAQGLDGIPGLLPVDVTYKFVEMFHAPFVGRGRSRSARGQNGSWYCNAGREDYPLIDEFPILNSAATQSNAGRQVFWKFSQTVPALPSANPTGSTPSGWHALEDGPPRPGLISEGGDWPEQWQAGAWNFYVIQQTTPMVGSSDSHGAWYSANIRGFTWTNHVGVLGDAWERIPASWHLLSKMQKSSLSYRWLDGNADDIRENVLLLEPGNYTTHFWATDRFLVFRVRNKPSVVLNDTQQIIDVQAIPVFSTSDNGLTFQELIDADFNLQFHVQNRTPDIVVKNQYDDYYTVGESPPDLLGDASSYTFLDNRGNVIPPDWNRIGSEAYKVRIAFADRFNESHEKYYRSLLPGFYTQFEVSELQYYKWEVDATTFDVNETYFEMTLGGPPVIVESVAPVLHVNPGLTVQWGFSQAEIGEKGEDAKDRQEFFYQTNTNTKPPLPVQTAEDQANVNWVPVGGWTRERPTDLTTNPWVFGFYRQESVGGSKVYDILSRIYAVNVPGADGQPGPTGQRVETVYVAYDREEYKGALRPDNDWGYEDYGSKTLPGSDLTYHFSDGPQTLEVPYVWRSMYYRYVPVDVEVGDAVSDSWKGPFDTITILPGRLPAFKQYTVHDSNTTPPVLPWILQNVERRIRYIYCQKHLLGDIPDTPSGNTDVPSGGLVVDGVRWWNVEVNDGVFIKPHVGHEFAYAWGLWDDAGVDEGQWEDWSTGFTLREINENDPFFETFGGIVSFEENWYLREASSDEVLGDEPPSTINDDWVNVERLHTLSPSAGEYIWEIDVLYAEHTGAIFGHDSRTDRYWLYNRQARLYLNIGSPQDLSDLLSQAEFDKFLEASLSTRLLDKGGADGQYYRKLSDREGDHGWATGETTPVTQRPGLVTGVSLTTIQPSSNSINTVNGRVSWTPPAETSTLGRATGYKVYVDTTAGVNVLSDTNVTATNKVFEGLTASTTYRIRIIAFNSAGDSTSTFTRHYRTGARVKTPVTPPPPIVVRPGSIGRVSITRDHDSMSATIQAPTTGGSPTLYRYELWQGSRPNGTQVDLAPGDSSRKDLTRTDLTFPEVSGLSASTSYTLYVRGENSAGAGPWKGVFFSTSADPITSLGSVTGIHTRNISTDSLYVSHNHVTNATGYEFIAKTSSATPSASTSGTAYNVEDQHGTEVYIDGLERNTTYYLFFRATKGTVKGPWTSGGSITTLADGVFSDFALSLRTDVSAIISFRLTGSQSLAEYYVSTSSNVPSSSTARTGQETVGTFVVTGLTANRTYYLFARVPGGAWTLGLSFSTAQSLSAVGTVRIGSIKPDGCSVDWDDVAGATGYGVKVSDTNVEPSRGLPTIQESTSISSKTLRGLLASKQYWVWVYPYSATQTPPTLVVGPIRSGSFTTGNLEAIRYLFISEAPRRGSSLYYWDVEWNELAGAESYEYQSSNRQSFSGGYTSPIYGNTDRSVRVISTTQSGWHVRVRGVSGSHKGPWKTSNLVDPR